MIYFTDYIFDLVQNSIKASAQNVLISLEFDKHLSFKIEDDGKGMDSEVLNRVKSFTYSTQKNRKVGLGLSMIHDLSKQTQGTFDLKSTLNEGTLLETTFDYMHIDFPDFGDIGLMISDLYACQEASNIILQIKFDKTYTFDLFEYIGTRDFSYQLKNEIHHKINHEITEIKVDYENIR